MDDNNNREIEIDTDKRPIVNASEARGIMRMVTQMKVWETKRYIPC